MNLICVNCSHRFKVEELTVYVKCPKCGDGRIWRDNKHTRKVLGEDKNFVYGQKDDKLAQLLRDNTNI